MIICVPYDGIEPQASDPLYRPLSPTLHLSPSAEADKRVVLRA